MDILPIRSCQPQPIKALKSEDTRGGVTHTAVVRFWNPGETRQCSRCSECGADHERAVCLVLVAKHLDNKEALDLSDVHVVSPAAVQPSSAC